MGSVVSSGFGPYPPPEVCLCVSMNTYSCRRSHKKTRWRTHDSEWKSQKLKCCDGEQGLHDADEEMHRQLSAACGDKCWTDDNEIHITWSRGRGMTQELKSGYLCSISQIHGRVILWSETLMKPSLFLCDRNCNSAVRAKMEVCGEVCLWRLMSSNDPLSSPPSSGQTSW